MKPKARSTAFIVLGMHRSGTSAAAGMLSNLGAEFGGERVPADKSNRKGYFENRRVVEAHDRVLAAGSLVWSDPLPPDREFLALPRVQAEARKFARMMKSLNNRAGLWGLKDPRMCRLLPLWKPIFASLKVVPCYVVTLRDPAEVAASLFARDRFSIEHAWPLWLEHLLWAEQDTRGQRRVFISYDSIVKDWRRAAQAMGEALRIKWPVDPARAADFVDPALRTHRAARQSRLSAALPLAKLTARAYEVFRSFAARGETARGRAKLDMVFKEYRAMSLSLRPWDHARRAGETSRALDKLSLAHARLKGEHRSLRLGADRILADMESSKRLLAKVLAGDGDLLAGVAPGAPANYLDMVLDYANELRGKGQAESAARLAQNVATAIEHGDGGTLFLKAAYLAGSALKQLGEVKRAAEMFGKVVNAPEHPSCNEFKGGANFHLGALARDGGDLPGAREHLKRCLELIPGHKAARETLAALKR